MNNRGYFSAIIGIILGFIIITLMAFYVMGGRYIGFENSVAPAQNGTSQYLNGTFGLKQYTDHNFGFSFWYPGNWDVREKTPTGISKFPGSKIVKYMRVGNEGNVYVYEISSGSAGITDNPDPAPFPPVNYSWDAAAKKWMVSWPQGTTADERATTTAAQLYDKTMSGLPIFRGTSRFDTNIIPLSSTKFVVISDGGGANADYLAKTVTPIGGSVNSPGQTATLKAEADAYSNLAQ